MAILCRMNEDDFLTYFSTPMIEGGNYLTRIKFDHYWNHDDRVRYLGYHVWHRWAMAISVIFWIGAPTPYWMCERDFYRMVSHTDVRERIVWQKEGF